MDTQPTNIEFLGCACNIIPSPNKMVNYIGMSISSHLHGLLTDRRQVIPYLVKVANFVI